MTETNSNSIVFINSFYQVIAGLARGCWILSPDWVKDSAAKGEFLPEADYELSEAFPGAKVGIWSYLPNFLDIIYEFYTTIIRLLASNASATQRGNISL